MTAEYNHNESSPSASWAINHALNSDSVVVDAMVYVGSPATLQKVLPADIRVNDADNITITFSTAQSGRARIVGEF